MKDNRQKKETNAYLISIGMHVLLFALLIAGSLQTIEIMGGGEGEEGDIISAVMVDTGSAA